MVQEVKNPPGNARDMRDLGLIPGLGRSYGGGNGNPLQYSGFPGGSAGKEPSCNVGDVGLIHGLGSYPGERKGYPFQYSGLKNPMECIVHGVTKSQIRLSNFHTSICIPMADSC